MRQWLDPNDSTYAAEGLLQTSDGGFVYGAQKKYEQSFMDVYKTATIVKMDNNFNKQWIFEGGLEGDFTGIKDIEILADGGYIACGNYSNIQGWVIKLDTAGHVIWERKYKGLDDTIATWNLLTDIDVLPDGGLIAVGQCQRIINPDTLPPQVGWFLKLDSNGCEIENCTVGIEEPREKILEPRIEIYPNPFSTDLSIFVQQENLKTAKFTITNIVGQVVYKKQEDNLSSSYTKILDLSYLPSGIYLVEVEVGGVITTKKIVKE